VRLTVTGIAPFINRLEKFDKDVSKALKKEMRAGADLVRQEAIGRVPANPVSNWGTWINNGRDVSYDQGAVRRSYKTVTNRYRRLGVTAAFGYSTVTESPAGAIFEQIGAEQAKGNTSWRSSAQFRRTVVNRHGVRPNVKGGKRILVPSYYAVIGKVNDRITAAIREAERKVGL
jgi:hypothetical protein